MTHDINEQAHDDKEIKAAEAKRKLAVAAKLALEKAVSKIEDVKMEDAPAGESSASPTAAPSIPSDVLKVDSPARVSGTPPLQAEKKATSVRTFFKRLQPPLILSHNIDMASCSRHRHSRNKKSPPGIGHRLHGVSCSKPSEIHHLTVLPLLVLGSLSHSGNLLSTISRVPKSGTWPKSREWQPFRRRPAHLP